MGPGSELMDCDIFIAGFGGQGILMLGNLLAYAAMLEGRNVSYFPAYGVEKRGGAATCTVVISDEEVGSPVIGRPGTAILLNQISLDKYFDRIRPGGLCIVNTSLVEMGDRQRDDLDLLPVPVTEIALDVGDNRLVNMVAAGAWAGRTGKVSLDSIGRALEQVLPARNHRFIPLNMQAMERGAACARS